ncbi:hypothetical protein Gorai_003281 [Gossypium raimondii]|uniref:Uncharacterized protein n=1 Tax=Gossypium raimondii TaxID=29730 RepID=A0A7J8QNQ4_GOSRA|nr:hypothetical protein [Gossypium raimondii]
MWVVEGRKGMRNCGVRFKAAGFKLFFYNDISQLFPNQKIDRPITLNEVNFASLDLEFREWSSSAVASELERAAKKVKNREVTRVESGDQEKKETTSKASFRDMLMSNIETEKGNDIYLDQDEICLNNDDIHISMDIPYPNIYFSDLVHDLSMKQTTIFRLLGCSIGY